MESRKAIQSVNSQHGLEDDVGPIEKHAKEEEHQGDSLDNLDHGESGATVSVFCK
ncbi:hypothetical protein MKP05_12130 [Halomonas sp. EGI 63088]|uniref:Uncharacterized protein n=1 Tax=Halomonas flagellata TaxID=2920385 RepID=A0ABS9RVL4_9GAMM|nr:hypothetical protein [Halomonas flagellata]MCH4563874.1 hypothetical protein [Halomonas flagellata]